MKLEHRFRWAVLATVVCFAAALGVNLFYNQTHEVYRLHRGTFQALFAMLLGLTLAALLAAVWLLDATRDEVQRSVDRLSVYWGWALGAFLWCLTPWVSSLPDALVGPLSNPHGTTLFTLSEAAGAYLGGGLVLILIVSVCSSLIQASWWLVRR